jgi:hypothetical protein
VNAYVLYYGPEPKLSDEETPKEREARLAKPPIVEFDRDPLWKLPAKELADVELLILERMGVSVGQHFCQFSVEELPEGEFALVCRNHPG